MPLKVVIIGGMGAFGFFYAKQLAKAGFDVSISSRDIDAGKKFCEKEGFAFSDGSDLKEFDVVIVSAPNESTPKILATCAKKMKKGALLTDFCSVKSGVEKEYLSLKEAKNELELASIHPMHGPRVNSILGFPVVVVEIAGGEKLKAIEKFFSDSGADLIHSNAKEHDEVLSIVQGLTHYSQFVSASVIKDIGTDLKKTMRFGSANYSLFISLMSRIILQDPSLYAEIQLSNPNNEKMRELFTKNAKELENICTTKNAEALKKRLLADAQAFKESDLLLLESDRMVNAVKYVVTTLKDSVGKKFLVENIITHSFHYGKILSVNHELVMEEKSKEISISLNKLRPCSKEEMLAWKEKNLTKKHFDYSFLVPKECDARIVLGCLGTIKECSFELIEEYSGEKLPLEKKSLTIRAHFFEGDNKKEIDEKALSIIKGLGFSQR